MKWKPRIEGGVSVDTQLLRARQWCALNNELLLFVLFLRLNTRERRMRLHGVIGCITLGIIVVDLTFDSLLLKNSDAALRDLQTYYAVVRSSHTVHVITALNVLSAVSLVSSLVYRRSKADVLSAVGLGLLLPFFMFVMEPIENACISRPPITAQTRHDHTVVAIGHIAIGVVIVLLTVLQTDWSFGRERRTGTSAAAKKNA